MSDRKLQKILNAIGALKDDMDHLQRKLEQLTTGQESLHVKLNDIRFGRTDVINDDKPGSPMRPGSPKQGKLLTRDGLFSSSMENVINGRSIADVQQNPNLRPKVKSSTCSAISAISTRGLTVWPRSIQMRQALLLVGVWSEDVEEDWLGFHKKSTRSKSFYASAYISRIRQQRLPKLSTLTKSISPDSNILVVLDVLELIALANDIIVTPFVVAWDLPMYNQLSYLGWFATLYWTCDTIINFRKGFFHQGELNMSNADIIRNYLRRSFMLDFVLLLYDWLFVATVAVQNIVILRALRIIKIFRIVRLVRLVDKVADWSTSSTWQVAVLLFKICATVLILNHLMSCGWFFVGRNFASDTGKRWILHTPYPWKQEEYDFLQMDLVYQYVLTSHWITAEMSLAGVHIEPANSAEGIISIFLLIWGLLVGGTIAGVFSSQIVEIHAAQREKIDQLANLRHFLSQRNVDPKLAYRVQKQAESRLSAPAPLLEEDVAALEFISSSLRTQLFRAMRSPYVLSHSLFQVWKKSESHAVGILCEYVTFTFLSPQDVLFEAHTSGDAAYYLVGKRMKYLKTSGVASTNVASLYARGSRNPFQITEDVSSTVDQGSWLSEAAWWSEWLHVGTCEAVTNCQVLIVNSDALLGVSRALPAVGATTKDYGSNFYIRIVSAQPPYSNFPDDLHVPFTDPSDLLANDIGLDILSNAQKDGTLALSREEIAEFEDEIIQGKCALQRRIEDGSLERIVAVAAVRLARDDGCILVQVGKWDPRNLVKPCCLLPGTKRKRGELPQDAMARILETDLSVFRNGIVIGHTKTDMFMKEAKWGVRTKYLRTECDARLQRDFQMPKHFIEAPSKLRIDVPVPPRKVYILEDGNRKLREKKLLFAWLSEAEFNRASLPGNETLLDPWLSSLDIPLDNDAPSEIDDADGIALSVLDEGARSLTCSWDNFADNSHNLPYVQPAKSLSVNIQ